MGRSSDFTVGMSADFTGVRSADFTVGRSADFIGWRSADFTRWRSAVDVLSLVRFAVSSASESGACVLVTLGRNADVEAVSV